MLNFLTIADVANGAQHQQSILGHDRTETYFDRELRTVPPLAVEVQACTHAPRLGCTRKIAAMLMVRPTKPLRNQLLNCVADQFIPMIIKQLLGL